jgi:hypothetical protein
MNSPTQTDWKSLQVDLISLKSSTFVGVLVGVGSIILHFSNGSSVLVQCPFEVFDGASSKAGHGEAPASSLLLFGLLNGRVDDASIDAKGRITFQFGASSSIRIVPDGSGYESYVLRTSKGTSPVY